jgi:flagellar FliL protein
MDKKKSLIRDIVIRSLSSKTFEEVSTIKGKDRLKDEIVTKINDILADGQIRNIFFTDFVVQ